jgi:hypothetical protein
LTSAPSPANPRPRRFIDESSTAGRAARSIAAGARVARRADTGVASLDAEERSPRGPTIEPVAGRASRVRVLPPSERRTS